MNIIVFQQFRSGEKKIKGIARYGKNLTIAQVINYDEYFPDIIEYPEDLLPQDISCDLVLNYLVHPDLSSALVDICIEKEIPVVTTGKRGKGFTPFTCCGLGTSPSLGEYGRQFGFPAFDIAVQEGKITAITVKRGAPCGATWDAAERSLGLSVDEVLVQFPLTVQQFCIADPSSFDPLSGKSPVHFAADVHSAALKKAIHDQTDTV